jgi:hypothetical protein
VYLNTVIGLGLSLTDLDLIEYGTLMDMVIEVGNNDHKYNQLATQDDFDRF